MADSYSGTLPALAAVPMDYLEWNDALVDHFFRSDKAGRQVYLYVTEELIRKLGEPAGLGLADFAAAVTAGPPWATRDGLCQRAMQAMDAWRERGRKRPPYVGYLALFVLAAGIEGDYAPHAYYPRLRQLIGYPDGSMLPSFDRMLELWDDLEHWSLVDLKGDSGVFTARFVGSWIHVGVPISQRILTEEEREELRLIFWDGGLDPASVPAEAELARVLRTLGGGRLRPRTVELISGRKDADLYKVLIETVLEELADWNGQLTTDLADPTQQTTCGTVRLCLSVDPVVQSIQMTARCRLPSDFPAEHLSLTSQLVNGPLTCDAYLSGWSTPLWQPDQEVPLDAAKLALMTGGVFESRDQRWRFRLQGKAVRVLVDGRTEGLPGLVELNHFAPSQTTYLLCSTSAAWTQLEAALQKDGTAYEEVPARTGLPGNSKLVRVRAMRDSKNLREAFPGLAPPERPRIRFVGGLRHSRGNTYLAVAPPQIVIDPLHAGDRVLCQGAVLSQSKENSRFALPRSATTDARLTVELDRSGEVEARSSVYLASDCNWRLSDPLAQLDKWGLPAVEPKENTFAMAGALASGITYSGEFRISHQIDVHQMSENGRHARVLLIGRSVGQVVEEGDTPPAWDPVWAIVQWRRPVALFCGTDLDSALPDATTDGTRHSVRRWKDILWYRRKRVRGPSHPLLAELWAAYRKVAGDA